MHIPLRSRKFKDRSKSIYSIRDIHPKSTKVIHEIRRNLANDVYVLLNKSPVQTDIFKPRVPSHLPVVKNIRFQSDLTEQKNICYKLLAKCLKKKANKLIKQASKEPTQERVRYLWYLAKEYDKYHRKKKWEQKKENNIKKHIIN